MSLLTIFPMSGANRYESTAFHYPKPLIEIGTSTMVGQAIEPYCTISDNLHFAVNKNDVVEYRLDLVIKNNVKNVEFSMTEISAETSGALATCMLVAASYPAESELIIANYDQAIDFSVDEAIKCFRDNSADFGCVTFESSHPKWSFVEVDNGGTIKRFAEKVPISTNALVGFYYFKSIGDFRRAAERVVMNSPRYADCFYVSEAFNQLILVGKIGQCFEINPDQYVKFTEPTAIDSFNKSLFSVKKRLRLFFEAISAHRGIIEEDVFADEVLVTATNFIDTVSKSDILSVVDNLIGCAVEVAQDGIICEGNQAVFFLKTHDSQGIKDKAIRVIFDENNLITQIKFYLI